MTLCFFFAFTVLSPSYANTRCWSFIFLFAFFVSPSVSFFKLDFLASKIFYFFVLGSTSAKTCFLLFRFHTISLWFCLAIPQVHFYKVTM